jgi:hypothetical protein
MLPLKRLQIVVAVALTMGLAGCPSKTATKPKENESRPANSETKSSTKTTSQPAAHAEHKTAGRAAKSEQPPPPPPTIPKVALSDALQASCLVKVGDALPAAELSDAAGKTQTIASLYGRKLTVVCLWTIGTTERSKLVAEAVLEDLTKDVVEPYGDKGVRVVGINVGDPAAAVQEEFNQASAKFPCLLDPKGEFLAKIARDKQMPRVFLLDGAGKILWFDVEYSRPSHRDLVQSIGVALGKL